MKIVRTSSLCSHSEFVSEPSQRHLDKAMTGASRIICLRIRMEDPRNVPFNFAQISVLYKRGPQPSGHGLLLVHGH